MSPEELLLYYLCILTCKRQIQNLSWWINLVFMAESEEHKTQHEIDAR